MFRKIDVNGTGTHPLYRFLKGEAKGVLGTEAIKWNFTKFLVDRQGNVAARFAPSVTPDALHKEIEKLL
jgi:glutathione peroxidase